MMGVPTFTHGFSRPRAFHKKKLASSHAVIRVGQRPRFLAENGHIELKKRKPAIENSRTLTA